MPDKTIFLIDFIYIKIFEGSQSFVKIEGLMKGLILRYEFYEAGNANCPPFLIFFFFDIVSYFRIPMQ